MALVLEFRRGIFEEESSILSCASGMGVACFSWEASSIGAVAGRCTSLGVAFIWTGTAGETRSVEGGVTALEKEGGVMTGMTSTSVANGLLVAISAARERRGGAGQAGTTGSSERGRLPVEQVVVGVAKRAADLRVLSAPLARQGVAPRATG